MNGEQPSSMNKEGHSQVDYLLMNLLLEDAMGL